MSVVNAQQHIMWHGRQLAKRMVLVQLCASAMIVILFAGLLGVHAGLSAAVGVAISILPNLYFSAKVFAVSGASRARQLMKSFYVGQTIKTALIIAMFVLAYLYLNVEAMVMTLSFILATLTHRLAPLVCR